MPVTIVARGRCSSRAFYVVERRKERRDADPLFEFGLLRYLSFRYGLLTTMVLALGQLGFLFVLPVFLQDGLHLSAVDNGLWLLPSGISIIVGTQIGARAHAPHLGDVRRADRPGARSGRPRSR